MTDEGVINQKIFEYVPNKEDYILTGNLALDILEVSYKFSIGNHTFLLPDGIYVLMGCCETFDGDWVRIDEVIGREIEVFMIDESMTKWKFRQAILKDTVSGASLYMPHSKNIIPIYADSGWGILVSYTDQYRNVPVENCAQTFMV